MDNGLDWKIPYVMCITRLASIIRESSDILLGIRFFGLLEDVVEEYFVFLSEPARLVAVHELGYIFEV